MDLLIEIIASLIKLCIPIALVSLIIYKHNKEYKSSAYYQITKSPYLSVHFNKGKYGEYLIYTLLRDFEKKGARFLFNIYIPQQNNKTTEIDVLMICHKGIFVFESKNYSGWIFGSENQKNWCQTLPRGQKRKAFFYNPIMQNHSHIKHLKTFLGEHIPMYSIIAFSNRCTLKKIQIQSENINVINRHNVVPIVSQICNQIANDQLNDVEIKMLYDKLYPLTQLQATAKEQHILNVHKTINEQLAPRHDLQKSPKSITPNPTTADNPSIHKCPKCNGTLILRTATRGVYKGQKFYGCSNYPTCKYIQNISGK